MSSMKIFCLKKFEEKYVFKWWNAEEMDLWKSKHGQKVAENIFTF